MKYFLLFLLSLSARAEGINIADKVIPACEGEGCDCTREKLANKDFTLYADHSRKSKVLGKFKKGTEVSVVGTYTIILDRERMKVTKVNSDKGQPKSLFQAGDELNTLFNLGEGHYLVLRNDKQMELFDNEVDLKVIHKGRHEAWTKVQVGKLSGYTPMFPLEGCLE